MSDKGLVLLNPRGLKEKYLRGGNMCECLLVDVALDAQQVVGHGLQRELMQQRRHRVKASVQDDELSPGFVWTLTQRQSGFSTTDSSTPYTD